jgi:hypothetical protein
VADDLGIYDAVAAALADRREPDLSPFEPAQVQVAMQRVLGSALAKQTFLTWLGGRVRGLSGGSVSVEELPPEDIPTTDASRSSAADLPLRIVVQGEPFAEPAMLHLSEPVVRFPMRT